ncbi:MAG: NYN domain-containing protein [Wenzhouxiangellaceae bacterium]
MNTPTRNLALFCDFENIALGVRDARYSAFDIKKVLERLLLKGNIVVKKAYCDWQRYKEFKPAMHEAAFELIEIPHLRMSGKNSADIRMVVDALDLCYTKAHVDTFVVISGDSDFSPLVSKLRENNKLVIGVGVKSSTSDLLTANCDEFIFYDDLVRDSEKKSERKQRAAKKKSSKKAKKKTAQTRPATNGDSNVAAAGDPGADTTSDSSAAPVNEPAGEEERRQEAFDLVLETIEALFRDRDESEKVWGSMVKQTLKRRRPGFSESYHGFKSFGQLLEQMQSTGLVKLRHDEKSGGYIIMSFTSDD